MQHPDQYPDAVRCIKNRRYTPAASFMTRGIVEQAIHRVPAGQKSNLTRTIARRLRNSHTKLLLAKGGTLRAMAEQAYQDVEGEMQSQPGT